MPRKTRILILSDTHNHPLPNAHAEHAFRHPLPAADVLIHAGDLTMSGARPEHDAAFTLVSGAPAPLKLVIAGNHDLTLDPAYVARADNPAMAAELEYATQLWTGEKARAAGIKLLGEGTHEVGLPNGSSMRVYASPYTPEFFDWAFMYPRSTDRFNARAAQPIPDGVDIVVTHGPPAGYLGTTSTGVDAGCAHLLSAIRRARPLLHCFGHIHEAWGAMWVDWARDGEGTGVEVDAEEAVAERGVFVDATGVEKGKESLLVNASIMNINYRPRQAPWVVDLPV